MTGGVVRRESDGTSRLGLPSPGRESASLHHKYHNGRHNGVAGAGVERGEPHDTNTDRMSVRSATLSLYKSEESLDQLVQPESVERVVHQDLKDPLEKEVNFELNNIMSS